MHMNLTVLAAIWQWYLDKIGCSREHEKKFFIPNLKILIVLVARKIGTYRELFEYYITIWCKYQYNIVISMFRKRRNDYYIEGEGDKREFLKESETK